MQLDKRVTEEIGEREFSGEFQSTLDALVPFFRKQLSFYLEWWNKDSRPYRAQHLLSACDMFNKLDAYLLMRQELGILEYDDRYAIGIQLEIELIDYARRCSL